LREKQRLAKFDEANKETEARIRARKGEIEGLMRYIQDRAVDIAEVDMDSGEVRKAMGEVEKRMEKAEEELERPAEEFDEEMLEACEIPIEISALMV
jgi:hypothetical protein